MTRLFNIFTAVMLLMLAPLAAVAQRFYNLTASEVTIGDELPVFKCSLPLTGAYADSTYTVQIAYPEFIDMSPSDIAAYKALGGKPLPDMPEPLVQIVTERRRASLETAFCPLVCRGGRYRMLVSFMLKTVARPKDTARRRAASHLHGRAAQGSGTATQADATSGAASRYAASSVLAAGRWAKIRVPSTGVYQLTESLVRQAGFSSLAKVRVYGYGGNMQNETLSADELQELDDLKEVPTCTVGGRRLFYAKGPVSWDSNTATRRTRNPYSDYGYYFITQGDDTAEPLSVDSAAFVAGFYPSPYYYHTLHEQDGYAWMEGGRNLFDPHLIERGATQKVSLGGNANATRGTFTVTVTAGDASQVEIALNDSVVGTLSISRGVAGSDAYEHTKGAERTLTFGCAQLKADNIVSIRVTGGAAARLDFAQVAWDKPLPLPSLTAGVPVPQYVYNITNQNHHADPQADMVIVIPTSQKLLAQAQRLADFHRSHDGLRVNVVPADELINEFGSGTPDANAYRRYLKMLYDRASGEADMPRYLLLFGDCVWDNRMLTTACSKLSPDDYLLCHESENSYSQTDCYVDDGFFCLLDDGEGAHPDTRDKLDVAVGRFPVTTEAEAEVLVDKTINYALNKNAGAWQNTLVFMGDDGNNNLHMRDENLTADMVAAQHPGFVIRKIMWDAYERVSTATGKSYPEVTRVIKQQQQQGALVMNYAGHGAETQISHEKVIVLSDVKAFNNANLPLWVTASCDIMPYDGTQETIGEAMVLNDKGGAVAFFGTTRTVYTNYNVVINQAYMRHVLSTGSDGHPVTIGEAQRLAKNQLIDLGTDRTVNKLQYALLGDPALALALPQRQMVVDSINGQKLDGTATVQLKAGSVARISGHVEGDASFGGVATVMVRDAAETVTCRMNDEGEKDGAKYAFTYTDRTATLFQGSDSIRGGRFDFSFAVPRDLKYSDGMGLINLYGVSTDRSLTANGWCDRLTANGSLPAANDSIGPAIFCYLNSPSFTNGGRVNSTPYFVAQVSDQDGINASGNGIGHDMQLVVDGSPGMTYDLNSGFSFDFGSYTSGTVSYALPELEPGQHSLTFRVWDVLNNPSTTRLDFTVVKGLKPSIFSVNVTDNPASTSTTFIINHDRTGCNVDVAIELFDMSGRRLWRHAESGVSTDSTYTVDWDLTTGDGRRLQTGVYLYRVCMGSDGSGMATKAKKLIVVDRQ